MKEKFKGLLDYFLTMLKGFLIFFIIVSIVLLLVGWLFSGKLFTWKNVFHNLAWSVGLAVAFSLVFLLISIIGKWIEKIKYCK